LRIVPTTTTIDFARIPLSTITKKCELGRLNSAARRCVEPAEPFRYDSVFAWWTQIFVRKKTSRNPQYRHLAQRQASCRSKHSLLYHQRAVTINTEAAAATPLTMPSTDGVQQRGPSSWPLLQGVVVSKKKNNYESPPPPLASRTIIMAGNERQRHPRIVDHRDDDDYDDPTMILSRLDIEIQGIGRPRNQSKVQQSLEDDYRDMMRRLAAFIHDAKRYHHSLQKTQGAKEKVRGLGKYLLFVVVTVSRC
jgi:hypothetical protein